jgi:hypothetical protein
VLKNIEKHFLSPHHPILKKDHQKSKPDKIDIPHRINDLSSFLKTN